MRAALLVLLLLSSSAAAHVRHRSVPLPLPRPAPCQCATQTTPSFDIAGFDFGPPVYSFTPAQTKVTVSATPPQEKKGHAMSAWFWKFVDANLLFCIAAALVFLYYTVRHGYPWVSAKISSIWNSAKADIDALDGRVATIETTIGIPTPTKPSTAVKPTKAPAAPVAAAPAAPDIAALVKAAVAAEMAKVAPVAVAVPTAPAAAA